MPNTIRIARGLKSSMPPLSDGQLYMCRDTGELYVGNNGNKPLVLAGTAEHAGMVRLNGAVDSASTNEAATPNAVRMAYELANSKAGTNTATGATNGLMSAADKSKLDGVQAEANKTNVVNSVSSTSTADAAAAAAVKQAYDLANGKLSTTGGVMTGQLTAGGTLAIGAAQVRNIRAGTSDMTSGSTTLSTGEIYFVYE